MPADTVISRPAGAHSNRLAALTLGAVGVVFGDIGTSPLYAFKEAFGGAHRIPLNEVNVLGVLSLIFWSVMLIVSVKYVSFVLRFDNKGEGGVLALLAFATRLFRGNPKLQWTAGVIAVFAASLFYGDAVITPAISVLSAVEGLSVATPALEPWVVPVTLGILIGLFAIQSHGTGKVGRLFGPITVAWFLTIGALGIASIVQTPEVARALEPNYAIAFAVASPGLAFLALGAVFLTLTGGEALYADMGHFGRLPIRVAWFGLVLPALMLNYLGQGALVLRNPEAVKNPFYLLAPPELLLPLVALATAATVIASQAVISGAFSVTQQASRLGYLPRIPVTHTSETERGQIYIGRLNWTMLVIVVLLVLGFGSSSDLAAAYGVAVSATMVLETSLVALVVFALAGRARVLLLAMLAVIATVEFAFLASNATKIAAGGWFPLLCGLVVFTLLTTWKRATDYLNSAAARRKVPIEGFFEHLGEVATVPGTAVFFSADPDTVPTTLLHNLKHNKVLHERVVFLTVLTEEVPIVSRKSRWTCVDLGSGFYQVIVRYGFMEDPDIPEILGKIDTPGVAFPPAETTYFLGKETILPTKHPGMAVWREKLLGIMTRNAGSATNFFRLPPNRVVVLGAQIEM